MRAPGRRYAFLLAAAPGTALAAMDEGPLTLRQPSATAGTKATQAVTGDELHDIAGPVPLPWHPPLWEIGAGLALMLAILAALFYLKKRKNPAPAAPPAPWATALAELAAARPHKSQGLLYLERVGEILRSYIEARFAIRSTRQTTREFLEWLNLAGPGSPLAPYRPELQSCLEQADMAKFARLVPDDEITDRMERAVNDFINRTIPEQPSAAPGKGGPP